MSYIETLKFFNSNSIKFLSFLYDCKVEEEKIKDFIHDLIVYDENYKIFTDKDDFIYLSKEAKEIYERIGNYNINTSNIQEAIKSLIEYRDILSDFNQLLNNRTINVETIKINIFNIEEKDNIINQIYLAIKEKIFKNFQLIDFIRLMKTEKLIPNDLNSNIQYYYKINDYICNTDTKKPIITNLTKDNIDDLFNKKIILGMTKYYNNKNILIFNNPYETIKNLTKEDEIFFIYEDELNENINRIKDERFKSNRCIICGHKLGLIDRFYSIERCRKHVK